MPLEPGTRIGPYEIVSLVGTGGMGEVYRATDTVLKRSVAVKVLREIAGFDIQRLARFRREAEVLASLNHPHIAHVYGLEESGDVRALVMEFVEGPTLAERIARGPIPLDEALTIARQLTAALDEAHQRGIVHRDLKPANIKLRPDGTVKVLDFGLAKAAVDDVVLPQPDATVSPTMTNLATMHGVLMGTAAYMSPEQARGEQVDRRADIWAFGVVLHEMVTGRRLFDGRTVADTVASVLVKDPDLSAAPPQLRPLLSACLERDVARRLRDIGDAWRLLDQGPVVAPLRARRFSGVQWAAAAVLVMAAGLAGWVVGRPAAPESKPLLTLPVDLGASLLTAPRQDVAISPDATHLAYIGMFGNPVVTGAGAVTGAGLGRGRGALADQPGTRLIVRSLATSRAVEIPGTGGAMFPFFSPNGRWVGFWAQGRLNKVAVDGGSVLPVAPPTSVGNSSVWSEDDTIFFTSFDLTTTRSTINVSRVPASGGDPRKVTSVEAGLYLLAQILPGGTHALATAYEGTRGAFTNVQNAGIEVLSLADGQRKVLMRGATSPFYSPTGHLLFVRQGTLFATRFDLNSLAADEDAEPILDDVEFANGGFTAYSLSSGGTLVYRRGGGVVGGVSGPRARLEWIDTTGRRSPVMTETRPYSRPRLSPDGNKLAVLITESDRRDEWVFDLRSGRPARITFDDSGVSTVAWSGDSKHLFIGGGGTGIHVAQADGAQPPRHLMNVEGIVPFVSAFSPQANRLAYSLLINPTITIFTVALTEQDGRWKAGKAEPFISSQFREQTPAFSLDGRWMAYTSDETGRPEVNVRPFPSKPDSAEKIPISTDGGENPRWGPGNELLYESNGRILSVRYTVTGDAFVPDAKSTARVARLGAARGDWDVAPDGRILAVIPEESTPQQTAAPRTVAWVENFFDELRRRVPAK